MYSRNFLYISNEEQERIRGTQILIAGVGLGSVIAEAALRLGFENLTIIDGDTVEVSNLNRQNYTHCDIGKHKTEALARRLSAINPDAKILTHSLFLTESNTRNFLNGCQIAVNTLDFDTSAPFVFDSLCVEHKIPVIHPFNFGWAGCAFVVDDTSLQINELRQDAERVELSVVRFILDHLDKNSPDTDWLQKVADEYRKAPHQSPPQLAVASYLTAGITANLMFLLANGLKVNVLPYSYFLSARL